MADSQRAFVGAGGAGSERVCRLIIVVLILGLGSAWAQTRAITPTYLTCPDIPYQLYSAGTPGPDTLDSLQADKPPRI